MAKREIVWTKYLTMRTLLRAWYVFENKNFKREIFLTKESTKASFAACHNALYNGLYYPDEELESNAALIRIKEKRELKKNATIANFMSPQEILMNIHAMYDCANSIHEAGLNATNEQIYYLCKENGIKHNLQQAKLNPKYICNEPEALVEVQPNCQRFVKKLKNNLKLANFVPATVYSELDSATKKEKFNQALAKYKKSYNNFCCVLAKHSIISQSSRAKVFQIVDSAFYGTKLPYFGVDFHSLILKENVEQLVTRKELEANTEKLSKLAKFLKNTSFKTIPQLETSLHNEANKFRQNFIENNKTYPECNKGFYNAFASALSQAFEFKDLKIDELGQNIEGEVAEMILKIKSLKKILSSSKNIEEIDKSREKLNQINKILND